MNNKEFTNLLEQICEDCCSSNHYCTLKEIILGSHPNPRFLVQLKCVEKYKYEKSKELNKDLGWNAAHMMWIDEGYAEKFAEVYTEGKSVKEIYKAVRG